MQTTRHDGNDSADRNAARYEAYDFPQSLRRAALTVATLASFLGPFMGSSVNVALPTIGQDLGLNAVALGWINMAFLLTAAAFAIPFGRLADIYGRLRIYTTGITVFTLSSVLIALATSGPLLIAGRVVQGLGASMIFATGMAILVAVFPPQERGRVLGITVAAVYLGLSLGPFVGGLVTEHLGWRFIFWLNLPFGLLLVGVVASMLKMDQAEARGERFDLPGASLLIFSLALMMYGFAKLPASYAYGLLGVGLAGMIAFVAYELRRRDPLLDIRLFSHNRVFAFSSLAALINYAATFAVSFLLSLYLQSVRGLSPRETGLVLVCQPAVQALFSPMAGRLSDRVEPRWVASAGMTLSFVGIWLLALVDAETSIRQLIGCQAVLGLGFALFSSPNTKAIMNSVGRRDYGVASAVVGTMRQIGMMLSMGIVMIVLTVYLGRTALDAVDPAGFVAAMKRSFVVFAIMCFGGIFASLIRGRTRV